MNINNPESLSSQLDFLSSLVKAGGLYSSPSGQQECVDKISEALKSFEWDEVRIQQYTAGELKRDPNYVPVTDFGDEYVDDEYRSKNNVIGVLRGTKPGNTVILNGHYDVEIITHPYRWERPWNSGEISDNKLWGRGSSDMLGGLSSQLFVASRLAQNRDDWSGQIIFNAVADEEVGGNGTLASLHALQSEGFLDAPESTACLIAEPSSEVIGLESLGFLHMILRAEGLARHMAGTVLRENVLYDMIDTISDFGQIIEAVAEDSNVDSSKFWHTFGLINGGIDAATPMPEVTAESTVFYPADISLAELRKSIINHLNEVHPGIESSFSDFYFDGHKSEEGALTQSLIKTLTEPVIKTGIFPSPCDARLFGAFGLSEVIVYGPGSLKQAHAANEYIDIDDIKTYNAHLESALRTYLSD